MRHWLAVCLLGVLILAGRTAAAERSRSFPQTGHHVSGAFLQFWETHGGLATFGYPLNEAATRPVAHGGVSRLTQSFERARFELHPTAADPVVLVQVGAEALHTRGIDWTSWPATMVKGPGCVLFRATGHQVCGRFLAQWQMWGLAIYGQPLSDLLREVDHNGVVHVVQYFERARFELAPERAVPHDVVAGALERERLEGTGPQRMPVSQNYYFFPVVPTNGTQYGRFHHDYPATDIFTPIGSTFIAPTAGRIDYISRTDRWNPATNLGADRGGLAVSVVGSDGIRYYGSHLSAIAAGLNVGQAVAAGTVLGLTGQSGDARVTEPHLHFGISQPTTPDDWMVRRGQISPYPMLKHWQLGQPLRPRVPWQP